MIGRIPVLDVQPVIEHGKFAAKAVVGEPFTVTAVVFREGHDAVNASVVLTDPDGVDRTPIPMHKIEVGIERWAAEVRADAQGDWTFRVEGWSDPFATWEHVAEVKLPAGMDVELVFAEGALLLERAAEGRSEPAAAVLVGAAAGLRDTTKTVEERMGAYHDPAVTEILTADPLRDLVTPNGPWPLAVERKRALYGAWYEFFPRSEGAVKNADGSWTSGNFRTAAKRLAGVARMGFDVLYMPPIHPIGFSHRKGRNNTLTPGPHDPGVPWAIGSAAGGHDAIHPDLGTLEDFKEFIATAESLGIEVAMDLAIQASPDHPWVTEHPEFFTIRPDGTIAYAENPPKKYQDIFPINFDNAPEAIYNEVLRIVKFWMAQGISIFRVDNPHTKTVDFWQWLIAEAKKVNPDVIFLAEAFTKPAMMHTLGRIGYQQSYTYFTWKTQKWELEQYFSELRDSAAHMRPNVWPNTPDILHAYLQYGGPNAFKIRAALASMLSPAWGMYAGYELYEHVAVREGTEDYMNSEKYEYRPRSWDAAERQGYSLAPYIAKLNEIRRNHPALQELRNLRFHHADSNEIIVFSKRTVSPEGEEDTVIVVINLDPHGVRESGLKFNMPDLGLDWHEGFQVFDEITGQTFHWHENAFVRLDPYYEPAHILHVRRWTW